MARIYTKTGDDGTTGLIGGKRVMKDSPKVEAYGSLDELNALLGLVRSHPLADKVDQALHAVQEDLFAIGAELATPADMDRKGQGVGDREIDRLENEIDMMEESLEPLKRFILPGGSTPGAELHLARAVARRVERQCVALSRIETVDVNILRYLNRLSDLLFVMPRYVNRQLSVPEPHPVFRKC